MITLQHLLGTCECRANLSYSEPGSHHSLVFISRNLCSTPDVGLNTPLHVVAKLGYMDIVEELLKDELLQQNHVKLNARNSVNKTPAHLAAEYGHYRLVIIYSYIHELCMERSSNYFIIGSWTG